MKSADDSRDPTENVKALNEAANKRQDDLRAKDKEISDIKHQHAEFVSAMRAAHNAEMGHERSENQERVAKAEAGRIDSIRQVDREEVAKTAVAANTAITTLAKQTTDLQQTLAKQVTDTAAAQEARNSAQYSDINKRISALELSSSEGKGKQTVSDPQMERLTEMVTTLARNQASGSGKSEGINSTWVVLIGAVSLVAALVAIYSATRAPPQTSTAPQVIYVPAPQVTPVPQPVSPRN